MASKSPSYALLTSNQYLRRTTNDTSLNPSSNGITVSTTFDPEAYGAAIPGTIVGKYREDNNQRGWRLKYNSSGKISFEVYSNGNGTVWTATESASAVRIRTNVTCSCDLSGAINIYLNGTLNNGTPSSAGTFSGFHASTEPLQIGADSHTSGIALNVWKGAINMVSVFNNNLTSGTVASISANGILTSAMSASPDLQAYWKHDTIQGLNNNDFNGWVDTKASLALTNTIASGIRNVKVQTETGPILAIDQWDTSLTNVGLNNVGLTSTYSLVPPRRLWANGATEPQIASGYRSYSGDWTAIVRCRKVTGRTTADIMRRFSFFSQYVLSNKEFYCILGADNSGSSRRISWGLNLFPIEGEDAVIVFRHNAVEKDVDLFINLIKYAQVTNVGTSAFEATTGLYLSESADFVFSSVTPACLSDEQVEKFVNGLAQNTYGTPITDVGYINYSPTNIQTSQILDITGFAYDSTVNSITSSMVYIFQKKNQHMLILTLIQFKVKMMLIRLIQAIQILK